MKIRKLIASLLACAMLASAATGLVAGAENADYEAYDEDTAIETAVYENGYGYYGNGNGYYYGDYYAEDTAAVEEPYDYDDYDSATPISGEMTITRRDVYTIAANFIADSIGTTTTNPLAFAQEVSIGLLTANDRTRYFLETGREFDLDTPITRQEYALIIDRMMNILRRFNIDLIRNEENGELLIVRGGVQSQLTLTDRGIGIIQSRASTISGIGTMSASFHYNTGAGRLQGINWYADADSVRGSARHAIVNMLNLGVLAPKTFEEKQIFYSHTPTLNLIEYRFEYLSAEEFEARNQAARDRFEMIFFADGRVNLERSRFTAPNDLLTIDELNILSQALAGVSE